MYIMSITETCGDEVWYDGPGWYYTNEVYTFTGPFDTEHDAVEAFAWHVHALFEKLKARFEAKQPEIIVPDTRLL